MSKILNNTIKYLLKTLKIFFLSVFILVVLSLIFTTVFVDDEDNKSFLGLNFYIVLSGSMKPEFDEGDLIIARKINTDKLVDGDIITYNSIDPFSFNEIITHEIVGETTYEGDKAFVTKGLANEDNDIYPVPVSKVIGKYLFSIPKAGYVIDYLKTDSGYIIFILIPFILLIGLEGYDIIKKIKKEKQIDIDRLKKEKEELEIEVKRLKEDMEKDERKQ